MKGYYGRSNEHSLNARGILTVEKMKDKFVTPIHQTDWKIYIDKKYQTLLIKGNWITKKIVEDESFEAKKINLVWFGMNFYVIT